MPLINGCCCFESLIKGSRASAIFTIVTAIIHVTIDIAILIRLYEMIVVTEPQQIFLYQPPGIIPLMFIKLFVSVGLAAVGVILLIGINYQHDGAKFVHTWLIYVIADRLYDVFLGVYFMAWTGGHRFSEMIYVVPECLVISIYWCLNSLILIMAIICVVSYWQELLDDLYGKERRIKYFRKMANIRSAALSGGNTPFRSLYGSKSSLMNSSLSINPSMPTLNKM